MSPAWRRSVSVIVDRLYVVRRVDDDPDPGVARERQDLGLDASPPLVNTYGRGSRPSSAPHALLGVAQPVARRGVDPVDPELGGAPDRGDRLLVVLRAPRVPPPGPADRPRAQADAADLQLRPPELDRLEHGLHRADPIAQYAGGMSERQLDTPHGPARVHLHEAADPRGALVLGHGAGGGVGAPDLVAATRAAQAEGFAVALVEQPYRVAGRRSPAPAHQLDAAWVAVCEQLPWSALPLVAGGRSAGARVACRTAAATGAAAVLCLAFPLHAPGRPERSRAGELAGAGRPVVVVQGAGDAFGTAVDLAALGLPGVEIVQVPA